MRFANGGTSSCSRPGNTMSIRRPRACSRRRAGIRRTRSTIRPAANWSSDISSRSRREPRSRDHIRTSSRVTAISRAGFDKTEDQGPRAARRSRSATRTARGRRSCSADAVIDTSGTWFSPNPAGANGLPAIGEDERAEPHRLRHARRARQRSRPLCRQDGRRARRRPFGDRHADRSRAARSDEAPATEVALAAARRRSRKGVRRRRQRQARGARRAWARPSPRSWPPARSGSRPNSGVSHIAPDGARLRVGAGTACCGRVRSSSTSWSWRPASGPQFDFLRELRLRLDPAVESPVALAPLIDPNEHSCGTVRPHGARELAQPEPGFYFAGMKRYGRAPTFLMLTGYEQVRSIVAEHRRRREGRATRRAGAAGDRRVYARRRGRAEEAGCCGGPAKVDASACCAADESGEEGGRQWLRVFMNDVAQTPRAGPGRLASSWRSAPRRPSPGHRAIICRRSWRLPSRATSA